MGSVHTLNNTSIQSKLKEMISTNSRYYLIGIGILVSAAIWFGLPSFEILLQQLIPQYYRSLIVIVIGISMWIWDYKILSRAGIPVNSLLRISSNEDCQAQTSELSKLCWSFSGIIAVSIFLHDVLSSGFENDKYSFPNFLILTSLAAITFLSIMPSPHLAKQQRLRFWRSCYRIAFGGFYDEVCFADVLVADVLTSYARVFGDFVTATCMLVHMPNNALNSENKTCQPLFLATFATALPYLFRFRQCIAEYITSNGLKFHQLWNALKYLSAFPPLFLGYYIGIAEAETTSHHQKIWFLFAIINSLFSYYWDVTQDWGLGKFNHSSKNFMLRDTLLLRPGYWFKWLESSKPTLTISAQGDLSKVSYHQPTLYYFLLIFNLFARFGWAVKFMLIGLGFDLSENWSMFTLLLLEVLRRSVWICFRIENQWLKEKDSSN